MKNLGLITSNYSSEKGITIFLTVLEKVCTHFLGGFVFDNKFVAPTLHILFCGHVFWYVVTAGFPVPKAVHSSLMMWQSL